MISPDLGVQVGDYRSAITLNQQAVALDLKLHAISPLKPIYLSYTVHNMEFCAWAAMYAGCREAALGAATQIDEFLTDEVPRALSLCLRLCSSRGRRACQDAHVAICVLGHDNANGPCLFLRRGLRAADASRGLKGSLEVLRRLPRDALGFHQVAS